MTIDVQNKFTVGPLRHGACKAVVASSLRKGDVVSFNGSGQFYVGRRAARTGRKPVSVVFDVPEMT